MVTGEEVLSKITNVNDENGNYLVLDNPIVVEEITVGERVGAKVSPWMKFSKERSFIVPIDRIVTCVECDTEVELFYEMSISKIDPEYTKGSARNEGHIGSVDDARKTLEQIFKKKNKWS